MTAERDELTAYLGQIVADLQATKPSGDTDNPWVPLARVPDDKKRKAAVERLAGLFGQLQERVRHLEHDTYGWSEGPLSLK